MSWMIIAIVGFIVPYALIALIIGPYIRRKDNAKIQAGLSSYRESCKQRDKEYPDMIGKWGKP